ncbi:MarR family winged helix-turn-helix transcriptional regulator [Planobispora longispora]|uniref:MarR family winged helix-turn-helix transcriptional regulator n=1 Tax=Planobispora longispora TaxID=28887 RepID=UPI001EF5B57D|nr:MarR family winged helix-turn-helix transcriptional regulator [Planobispora longispora]
MNTSELTEAAVGRWHAAVDGKDPAAARLAVCDPIVVNGPKGAGPITPGEFADWITRSGVELRPRSWHPIGDGVTVVEQDARWPQDAGWTRVATVFRVTGDRVSAALRFTDLRAALDFARLHIELVATEPPSHVARQDAVVEAGAGQALFRFVRHWSRRWNADGTPAERGRDVQVTEAVHALRGRQQVTVNDVAAELGIDQSGASRMVAHAVDQGYLITHRAPADARRRAVGLTDAGLALLDAAHSWQESTFAALTSDWTGAERAEFHRAMLRLLDRSPELSAGLG